jgi:hypothetical protein
MLYQGRMDGRMFIIVDRVAYTPSERAIGEWIAIASKRPDTGSCTHGLSRSEGASMAAYGGP